MLKYCYVKSTYIFSVLLFIPSSFFLFKFILHIFFPHPEIQCSRPPVFHCFLNLFVFLIFSLSFFIRCIFLPSSSYSLFFSYYSFFFVFHSFFLSSSSSSLIFLLLFLFIFFFIPILCPPPQSYLFFSSFLNSLCFLPLSSNLFTKYIKIFT